MGCTKCKKKTSASISSNSSMKDNGHVEETVSVYRLRDGISWEQLGYNSPSDAEIDLFLKINPNRKSLFSILPDNITKNSSKG